MYKHGHRLDKMTKERKIHHGDYVMYGRHEWIVTKKKKDAFKLVRRQILKGPPIWVNKSKLKLACQKWRTELKKNDTVSFFISGMWTPARITRRINNFVFVQPTFTNYAERIHQDSNRINYIDHNYPMWQEDTVRTVMYQGNIRTERGSGLLFPWEYVPPSQPAVVRRMKFITSLKFKYTDIKHGYYPFAYYNRLSTKEIVYDLFHNAVDQNILLHNVLLQYLTTLEPIYNLCPEGHLPIFVEIALANHDHRRVNELLSVGEDVDIFHRNEWAVWKHLSVPYFDLQIKLLDKQMVVNLFVNPRRKSEIIDLSVAHVLKSISKEDVYLPDILEVEGPTEQSYIVSRMIGMELEPLESIYLRYVHNSCWLTLHGGFCEPSFNRFGGVLSTQGCDFRKIVGLLMSKNPLKTLIIVDSDVISDWSNLAIWHGRRREVNDLVVVTTKNTFTKTWHKLVGFQRLICFCLPSQDSVYEKALISISCTTRWAIVNEIDYLNSIRKAFLVHGLPYDDRAVIRLSKQDMEKMGVEFPKINHQKIYFKPYDYKNVVANLKDKPRSQICAQLSKFLIHPSLVPAYLRGKKIDLHEATTDTICKKFQLEEKQLASHLDDKCAVCLETLKEAMVTPCGHVFCPTCVKELQTRNCKCPMCRGRIDGYIKVSNKNTAGTIVMHKGVSYLLNDDEKWGDKVAFLRKQEKSLVVTKYGIVKKKLSKELPKHKIVTADAIQHGLRVDAKKIIFLEPMETDFESYFANAWGSSVEITSLSYQVSNHGITLT